MFKLLILVLTIFRLQAQNTCICGSNTLSNGSNTQYGYTQEQIEQFKTHYAIKNGYGKVLDISQTRPTLATNFGFHGGVNQRFTIIPDGQDLVIRCVQTNHVLYANPKYQTNTRAFTGEAKEKWRLARVNNTNNMFYIVNRENGYCLDLKESNNADKNEVLNYPCHGLKNQQWQIIPIAAGVTVLPTQYKVL